MKVKYLFLIVVFPLFFLSSYSQAITLNEAINIALKNNSRILLAKEKVKEAEQKVKEATAGYLPSFNLNGTYTHLGEVPSISIPHVGEFPMGEQDTTSLTFSLTQPLYTSGKLTLASKQARLNYRRAKQDLKNTQDNLIFQVKQSFYSVLLAKENLKIREQALHQAKLHLKVVESFYQSGRASRFDLLRAKVQVANLKPDLIQAINNLNLARERLANLLSLPSSSLKIEGELKFQPTSLTLNEAIKTAFSSRADLMSLIISKDIAKLAVRMARVKNQPTLSFVGNYEYKISAEKDEWEKNWNINLVLSFPFFDSGKTKAFLEQRRSQLRQIELAVKQLKDAIQLEVKKAFWDLQAAKEALSAQKQNINQAQEALSIAEGRYKSGTITQVEVFDANLALTTARLNYTRALYDYNLARASLVKAIGKEIK